MVLKPKHIVVGGVVFVKRSLREAARLGITDEEVRSVCQLVDINPFAGRRIQPIEKYGLHPRAGLYIIELNGKRRGLPIRCHFRYAILNPELLLAGYGFAIVPDDPIPELSYLPIGAPFDEGVLHAFTPLTDVELNQLALAAVLAPVFT